MVGNLQGRTEKNDNTQLEERAREQFINGNDDSISDEMAMIFSHKLLSQLLLVLK